MAAATIAVVRCNRHSGIAARVPLVRVIAQKGVARVGKPDDSNFPVNDAEVQSWTDSLQIHDCPIVCSDIALNKSS